MSKHDLPDHLATLAAIRAKSKPLDVAVYLSGAEEQEAFLRLAFEDGDPVEIVDALGIVARARGLTRAVRAAGLRQGNLRLDVLLAVISALGFRLNVDAVKPAPKT